MAGNAAKQPTSQSPRPAKRFCGPGWVRNLVSPFSPITRDWTGVKVSGMIPEMLGTSFFCKWVKLRYVRYVHVDMFLFDL